MTLEDFFTLTEMKDGLTAPSRVHQLVSIMQKEKDCAVKNIGDATRQWAAVASTIAATENTDCLDLFIQLDGLWFIDRWLKDAQTHGSDATDNFIEQSITALLRALEKLQIGKERSVSSGIWITVNNLLDHSSSRVQDRARALSDRWNQGKIGDTISNDVQNAGSSCDVGVLPSDIVALSGSNLEASSELETSAAEPARDERVQSESSDCLKSEGCEHNQTQAQDDELLTHGSTEDKSLDAHTNSVTSGSVPESPSMKEKFAVDSLEAAVTDENHRFLVSKVDCVEPRSDAPNKLSNFPDESDVTSNNVKPGPRSSNVTSPQHNVAEPVSAPAIASNDSEFCAKPTAYEDQEKPVCASKASSDDAEATNSCDTKVSKSMPMDGQVLANTLQDSFDHGDRLEKPDDVGTSFSRMEDVRASDDSMEDSSDGAEDLKDISEFSKPAVHNHTPDFIDQRKSDSELDYGIVDALEVACQVAQEVERKVVDYKEPSCSSSSEKILKSGFWQPGSPDSISGKPEIPDEVPPEDVPTRQNHSAEAYSEGVNDSNNVRTEVENGANELESSQVTEVAQETEVYNEKGFFGLDLNQEVCSDDMDRPLNPVSAPVSIVSASKPAAASGSPAARFQFQGTLGWKGSSATSAFRPASPCKMPDFDKVHDTRVTTDSSSQKQNYLNIDLNMTEDEDEKAIDFMLGRPITVSSGLYSRESSLEVGPRSGKPNLDLNRMSDDGDALPSDSRVERQLFFPRNGHRSPSPASSSSSMQPSMRNFDLNDRPLFPIDSSNQGISNSKASQNVGSFGGSKASDPVICLFGTKVEVGSRVELTAMDFIPQAPALPNGKIPQSIMDVNVPRVGGVLGMVPTVSYTHSSAFGYNSLTSAPTMSIPPAVFGPGGSIPYMLDSRGAPVVPQIMGSSSTVPLSYAQQPFIMSVAGTPIALNGAVPSRPNFDLNSGFPVDGASSGGIRELFMPGQGRSAEEHVGSNSQASSSSGAGSKRKEPHGGWEPFHYKHPQPPRR